MAISPEQVEHVAHLARLKLTEQEKQTFARQLGAILDYMQTINRLDTDHVEPMLHGIAGLQPGRPDRVGDSLPRDQALLNAPDQSGGCFKVPRIIE